MLKFRNTLVILSMLLLMMSIFSCGRSKAPGPNILPFIEITSYEGADSLAIVGDSLIFQQKIYWNAYDEDGIVESYAFRIVNEAGDYISTPGYGFIDEDTGWVYHYQPGADESIPMNHLDARLTFWTKQVFAEINFPANVDGVSENVVSIFEVKCRDNRNGESMIARKIFNSYSIDPRVSVLSTKGSIDGKTIGTGVVLDFIGVDSNNGASDVPDYFDFMLIKGLRNEYGEIIPVETGGYDTTWISTKDLDNPSQFMLTQSTYPALIPNAEDPRDSTYLTAKVTNIAGVVSDPVTISFYAKEGFYPGSLIYNGESQPGNDVWVLGNNHFTYQRDNSISKIIEFEDFADGPHFSTPFWIDKDGNFAAIGSDDFKIYMHWGWHGEFGNQQESGTSTTDNPLDKRVGDVKDEQTSEPYFAEIQYFDIRVDGEPWNYPPLPAVGENLQTDDNGKEWLRIPITHSVSQNGIVTDMDAGFHIFEVRAVDIQNIGDETPARMSFKIIDKVPKDEKDGILILDDDSHHSLFAPDQTIDEFYDYIFSDYSGTVDVLDREELKSSVWDPELHFGRDVFSPTDLEKYKLIIFHSDYLTVPSNLQNEFEVLTEYLRGGGNLLICGGSAFINSLGSIEDDYASDILRQYFGISNDNGDIMQQVTKGGTSASFLNLQYFVKANAENSFSQDMDLWIYYDLNENGAYDYHYDDWNGNGRWDEIVDEPYEDLNDNDEYDEGEPFTDWNENAQWDENISEAFEDLNDNGIYDDAEPRIFNDLVFSDQALGPVVYFDENLLPPEVEVIYSFGCKEPGDGPDDPSQVEYDALTGQPVAIRRMTDFNSCYFFGFPFSYMEKEQAKTVVNQIISEMDN